LLNRKMQNQYIKLAPSILSADFSCLGEQIAEITKAGADYVHVDVMDGHFVPNITIGAAVVASIRSCTNLPLDVHLMVERPEDYVAQFIDAGADIITVHIELDRHIHRLVHAIKDMGAKAGIALNPATPLSSLEEILPFLDLVLIMTVNPGFGGQAFIADSVDKIARLRGILDNRRVAAELEVDGGITAEIAPRVVKAGADVLVAGAAIFSRNNKPSESIRQMRKAVDLAH
jgi:ribulose-phosphate 3-epimerase